MTRKPITHNITQRAMVKNKSNYHTPRWRKLRKKILAKNPFCVACDEKGIVVEANVCDHKHNWRQNPSIDFWNEDNLQALCRDCHQVKTNQECYKRKAIVYR